MIDNVQQAAADSEEHDVGREARDTRTENINPGMQHPLGNRETGHSFGAVTVDTPNVLPSDRIVHVLPSRTSLSRRRWRRASKIVGLPRLEKQERGEEYLKFEPIKHQRKIP